MASKKKKAKEQVDVATRVSLLTLANPDASLEELNRALGMELDASDVADAAGLSEEEQNAIAAEAGKGFNKLMAAIRKARG